MNRKQRRAAAKRSRAEPGHAGALLNQSLIARQAGRLGEALALAERALALEPDLAEAHYVQGTLLTAGRRLAEAVASFDEAIAARADYFAAHNNRGNALKALGRLTEAAASYRRALALRPDSAGAHNNLGGVLVAMRKPEDAIECFRRALAIDPGMAGAAANLLHQLQHACAWSEFKELEPRVDALTRRSIREGAAVGEMPFYHMTRCADPAENFRIARARSLEIAKRAPKMNFPPNRSRGRKSKITIGYLSANFFNHPTAHTMAAVFGLHDRGDFNVFAFSYGPDDGSSYRRRIERDSDRFFDIRDADFAASARLINDSGVDILVDLSGHTMNSRLEICAHRPAPVQVTYKGFPGTTGADFIDYILTDRIVTLPSEAPYYSERIVYLPNTYWVDNHTQAISDKPFRRADFGLPDAGFVFCCFNGNYKIDPTMFGVWMDLLKKTPNGVLWLLRGNDLAQRNLKREAEAAGVAADRLVFAPALPKAEHLARLRLADLALDTRIVGGHTTTADALWAGVPVIALKGSHFASRVSSSLLAAVGLAETVTGSLEAYQRLALDLARHPAALAALCGKLARNRETAPLFDTPRFVANLENAFRRMWNGYLAGAPPRSIEVREVA